MTDLEMTKLCGEAMGLRFVGGEEWPTLAGIEPIEEGSIHGSLITWRYDPLHDDAQAMALVKQFRLHAVYDAEDKVWHCVTREGFYGMHSDLNRAIVEGVAQMQKQRSES